MRNPKLVFHSGRVAASSFLLFFFFFFFFFFLVHLFFGLLTPIVISPAFVFELPVPQPLSIFTPATLPWSLLFIALLMIKFRDKLPAPVSRRPPPPPRSIALFFASPCLFSVSFLASSRLCFPAPERWVFFFSSLPLC